MEGRERILREKKLYEASLSRNFDSFNQLMEEDKLILARVSTTCFNGRPLHIAAKLGHLKFGEALPNHRPQLAVELVSQELSPLHQASADVNIEMVKLLMWVTVTSMAYTFLLSVRTLAPDGEQTTILCDWARLIGVVFLAHIVRLTIRIVRKQSKKCLTRRANSSQGLVEDNV